MRGVELWIPLRGGIIVAHVLLRIQIVDPPLLTTTEDRLFQDFSCYKCGRTGAYLCYWY